MNRLIIILVSVLSCAQAFAADVLIRANENVQQKIDASAAGDRITIEAGANIANVTLRNDRDYVMPRVNGLNNSGFTINARDLRNAKVDVFLSNANIDISGATDCTFTLRGQDFRSRAGDAARHCVYFDHITRCTLSGEFRNMLNGDTCVFGRTSSDCVFQDFNLYTVHEGIHILNGGKNTTIRRIFIDGIRRHGLEVQGEHDGLLIDTIYITGRLDTTMDMDISCATGGRHGIPGNGTTNTSRNVRINNFVIRRATAPGSFWWRTCGIEAMGQITITNGYLENCGQGILYGAVGPDWAVRNVKFKNVSHPFSGEPIAFTFMPKPENNTGNVLNYTGAIPTWEELKAGQGPAPTPPPNSPTLAARAHKSMVAVTRTPNAKLEKKAGDGVWKPVTLIDGFDKDFAPEHIANTWRWTYRATLNGVSSPEVTVQLNLPTNPADPTPLPPPPLLGDIVWRATINGQPVEVVLQRKADGTFSNQPTTRPIQPTN